MREDDPYKQYSIFTAISNVYIRQCCLKKSQMRHPQYEGEHVHGGVTVHSYHIISVQAGEHVALKCFTIEPCQSKYEEKQEIVEMKINKYFKDNKNNRTIS